ncbi:hypothetical protein C4544_01550 [candidate division WS5 bacterium]|uniref:Uncharacterized protein n=1 Tax=candidate division WS5 bacterium TaxID=2093353 RepID=A0A419DFI8_9BACT|nr:MAG: hypothetical protein C4544_01550 [candidate division WS5 bacterium]
MGIDIKTIGKVLQEAGKIELYQQVLDMQAKLNDFQDANYDLKKEIRKLKEKLETKNKLEFKSNAYWMSEKDQKVGPFCSRCMDTDGKLIRMHKDSNNDYFQCPTCKNGIGTRKLGAVVKTNKRLDFTV